MAPHTHTKSTGVGRQVQEFPLLLSDLLEEDRERFRRFRDGSVDDMVRAIIKEAVRMILCCAAGMVLYAIIRTPLPSRHCHRLPEIYSLVFVDTLFASVGGLVLITQTFVLRPGVGWNSREDSKKFFPMLGGGFVFVVLPQVLFLGAVYFSNYDVGANILFLLAVLHFLIVTCVLLRRGNHCPEPKELHSGLSAGVKGDSPEQRQARSDRFRHENRAAVFAWIRAQLWWTLVLFFIPLTYAEAFPGLVEQLADALGEDSYLFLLAQGVLVMVFFSIVVPVGGRLYANKLKKCVRLYDIDGEDTNLINPVHDDRAMLYVNLLIDLVRFALGRGILFSLKGYHIFFAILFKDFCYHAWHFGIKHSERWGGNGLIYLLARKSSSPWRKVSQYTSSRNFGL